jgi:hypothetical protein
VAAVRDDLHVEFAGVLRMQSYSPASGQCAAAKALDGDFGIGREFGAIGSQDGADRVEDGMASVATNGEGRVRALVVRARDDPAERERNRDRCISGAE